MIGFVAYAVVFLLGRPTLGSCLNGIPFLLAGLAARFWASGYLGLAGRAREIGVNWRIVSGPYRLLRHPLYIGNALLVVGMLAALRPGIVVRVGAMVGFVLVYALIVVEEERELSRGRSQKPEAKTANGEGRKTSGERFAFGRALCEWRTWVVTSAGYGLALLKVVLRAR